MYFLLYFFVLNIRDKKNFIINYINENIKNINPDNYRTKTITMKKALLIFCIIIFIFMNSFSQVAPVDKEREGAGFASLLLSGTSIDKQAGILLGGGGGFILKDVRMGGFFEGLVNNISFHTIFT